MSESEYRSTREDFPEFYRKLGHRDRWVPTTSDETAVPVGSILTGDELRLTFDRPEFDAPVVLGHMGARNSGITDDPEDETLSQRLEHWARDREYDFSRTIRPEYVEGFRDAQGVVLGLIQAWEADNGVRDDQPKTQREGE